MRKLSYNILKIVFLAGILGVFVGCDDDDDSPMNREQEQVALDKKLEEITTIAESVACDDTDRWTFTPIGTKPCGGPVGFLAYSFDVDVDHFLKKVEEYKVAMDDFNGKWGVISPCDVPPLPVGVTCDNGQAVLIYQQVDNDSR